MDSLKIYFWEMLDFLFGKAVCKRINKKNKLNFETKFMICSSSIGRIFIIAKLKILFH